MHSHNERERWKKFTYSKIAGKMHGSESERDYKWSLRANGHSQNDLEFQKNFVMNNGHGFSNTDTWREWIPSQLESCSDRLW